MSDFSEIFDRIDIQQVREFILHGEQCDELDHRSYEERIKDAQAKIFNYIYRELPAMPKECIDKIVCNCTSVYENVYMEVGMQAGAALTAQMFQNMAAQRTEEGRPKY